MALDTRTKRANVLGVGRPWVRTKEPDATKGEDWRIASGNATGLNALSPAAGGFEAAWAMDATTTIINGNVA